MSRDPRSNRRERGRKTGQADAASWWIGENLATYDLVDLLATLGSLQLIPENADRSARLESASAIVACSPSLSGQARVSKARLRQWLCDSEWAQSIADIEDPCPNLFTEQVTMAAGSFVAFPGAEDGIVFMVRHLLAVIASPTDNDLLAAFFSRAQEIAVAALAMSDEVAKRAGLQRHLEPRSIPRKDVQVPAQDVLVRLKTAVLFQVTEVAELLERHGLASDALAPFTMEFGTARWDGEPWRNPLAARPLVRCDGLFVVAAPSALLSALLRAILGLASERSLLESVALRFRRALYATTEASLGLLGSKPLHSPTFEPDGAPACEGFFSLDKDKVIHLLLISDDLAGWSSEVDGTTWEVQALMDTLQQRCQLVAREVKRQVPQVRKLLHLFVLQGVGRFSATGLRPQPQDGSLRLCIAVELIEITSLLDHSDPLALWKYARAVESLQSRTQTLSLGPLAEYELYLSHRKSFYLSDHDLPSFLVLLDDLAVKLRSRVAKRHDRHGAWLPSEDRAVEVLRLDPDADHPFFFEMRLDATRIRILVELQAVSIWLLCGRDSLRPPYGPLYLDFARAIAYWLWQVEPSLKTVLASLGERPAVLEWELEIVPEEAWFVAGHRTETGDGICCHAGAHGRATLRFDSNACRLFNTADNGGDRTLVAHLIRLIRACCEQLAGPPEAASAELPVETIVEAHAPLGHKRMISMLQTRPESSLKGEGLPPHRRLQDADQGALLDELGAYIQSKVGWEPGQQVAGSERVAFLGTLVVPFFFEQLIELLSTLRAEGLAEELVARHEALLHEQKQYELTLPTRLACYGGEEGFEARLRGEANEHREAAIASRFLIEVAAQQPPRGTEALSLEVYDRLLALSSAIFTWGTTSDYIHYQLADLQIEMLPSGRIGVAREHLEEAQQAFVDDTWLQGVTSGRRSYDRYWREHESVRGGKPPEVAELDRCTEVEFGLSLTDLVEFLSATDAVGWQQPGLVKVCSVKELCDALEDDLAWGPLKVRVAFEFFSLRPRLSFFTMPEPFQREDLYPWRFNRRLSYLRRPLVCQGEGESLKVIWGVGQLEAAFEYLKNLCIGGKLKAQSKEMKRLISKTREEESKAFNEAAAEVFEQAGVLVRRRVRKIGKRRIERQGLDLGDIDLLVVVPDARKMLAVEVKDLHAAKTPAEIEHELRATFESDPAKRSKATIHLERVEWLRTHIEETLIWLGLEDRGGRRWQVEGCIVVNAALFSPYLRRCPLPVIPWVRLQDEVQRLLKRH